MAPASRRSTDRARGAVRPVAWLGLGAALALGLQRVWTPGESAAADPVSTVTRATEVSGPGVHGSAVEGTAPTLPLPRMPGSTRLSSSVRFDAATNTWKLQAAFRVHAHVPHVLAFYRKALADEGLEVDEAGAAGEGGRLVLVGRNDRIHAQIGIRTKPHELETRIWVLWRVRA